MNKEIIEYKVLQYLNLTYLVKKANEAIRDGWQPIGSATFNGECFYQTMVKYDDVSISDRIVDNSPGIKNNSLLGIFPLSA